MRFQAFIVLLLVSLSRLAVCGAASPGLAESIPANARLVLLSQDVGATCSDFQATRLGAVLTGEPFRPLVESLRREHLGGPLHLRPIFGFDWSDLQDAHQPAAIVVFPLPNGNAARACLFAGGTKSDAKGPLDAATAYFQAQGYSAAESRRGELQLTTLTPGKAGEGASPRVIFRGPQVHGIADSADAAEVLLAIKSAASLATDSTWQAAAARPVEEARPGDLSVLLRPFEMWELTRRSNPPAAEETEEPYPATPDALASARQVGFDGIRAVVGRVSFPASEGRDWRIDAQIVADQPFEKAMRLLELQPGAVPEIPAFARADVTTASFWRWDFSRAMKGFGTLFDESNEPGPDGVGLFEDMLDGLRDDPEGVRVDLRHEVFAHLGPGIWSVTDRVGPKTKEQPHGDRALYVTTVEQQAVVSGALKRFYEGDDRVTHQVAGDFEIWTVPEGASLFVEGESDSVVSVRALALGNGQMLFSTDPEQLREALAGAPAMPLESDANWQQLWRAIAQDTAGLWGLAKLDETLAPEYAEATQAKLDKEASLLAALWRVLLFGSLDSKSSPPVDAAPKFEQIQSGLSRTATRIAPVQGGFEITIIGQRP